MGDQPDLQHRAVMPVASQLVEHFALLRHRCEQRLIEPGLLAGKFRAGPRERRADIPNCGAHLLAGEPAVETGADARLTRDAFMTIALTSWDRSSALRRHLRSRSAIFCNMVSTSSSPGIAVISAG